MAGDGDGDGGGGGASERAQELTQWKALIQTRGAERASEHSRRDQYNGRKVIQWKELTCVYRSLGMFLHFLLSQVMIMINMHMYTAQVF